MTAPYQDPRFSDHEDDDKPHTQTPFYLFGCPRILLEAHIAAQIEEEIKVKHPNTQDEPAHKTRGQQDNDSVEEDWVVVGEHKVEPLDEWDAEGNGNEEATTSQTAQRPTVNKVPGQKRKEQLKLAVGLACPPS